MLRSVKKKQFLVKTALWEGRAPQTFLCNTNACLIIIKKQTGKKKSEWFSWNLKGTGLGSNRGAVLNLVLLFIFVTRNSINFEFKFTCINSPLSQQYILLGDQPFHPQPRLPYRNMSVCSFSLWKTNDAQRLKPKNSSEEEHKMIKKKKKNYFDIQVFWNNVCLKKCLIKKIFLYLNLTYLNL